ncbi:putative RING-H2 finger protein ATL21A [Rutidosis leptorrhynchoides]|uniref:putative RING-H2 finger protein ATL21A n=1 Tax=Rutidosis leptorrhynchoides TaxID=125765 RepID=UPI003A99B730
METKHILHLIFSSVLLLTPRLVTGADDDCLPASCGPGEPEIRFPFRITGRQPSQCGFPGFDLSCNKQNRTVIQLPSSQSFTVTKILYVSQVLYIDPEFCQPNRITDFNLTNTPFDFSSVRSYTFYNCSLQSFGFMYPAVPFPCLSSVNYSVIAVRTGLYSPVNMPASCEVMKTIAVPVRWNGDIRAQLELMWFTPYCRSCEMEGRACGLKTDDGGQTVCLGSTRGLPKGAKYGLSIGIGIPALVCIVGLICFGASRVRDNSETQQQRIDRFSIPIIPQPRSTTGLSGATIESYPKTVLGESCRLPKDDGICSICLSDYKPKESLRTIPECNHYFHAECIDEWLKLNATCPVCRNSPENSSLVTPCSSTSSSSSMNSS